MDALIMTIVTVCQFKTADIPIQQKERCMEKMVNCAIVKDGTTDSELIKKCIKLINGANL